jgi:hypothetical protein
MSQAVGLRVSELDGSHLIDPSAGRFPISWRSVTLGLAAAIAVAVLSPYNDFVLENGGLAFGSLPASVLILLFTLVVAVNGPLRRFAPGHALSVGEITVAISMVLASCTVPHHGLLRFLIPSIIMPFYHGQSVPEYRDIFLETGLPGWMFPDFGDTPRAQWFSHPLVNGFQVRWSDPDSSPYAAWIVPMVTWGVFSMAMYGALLGIVAIVHRQWIENERLPFPLAQVQLALLEPPPRGRWLNDLMRRRSFWIALGFVFALQVWNGMAVYFPRTVPKIPVSFDLQTILTDPPVSYMEERAKMGSIWLGAVAMSYFLSTSTIFSLWFFFLAVQVVRMVKGTATGDAEFPGLDDQHFGSAIAFILMVLWIGRQHWRLVFRQAFRGAKPGEPQGRYLSYRFAFWQTVACMAVMVGWFMLAGSTLFGALVSIGLLILLLVLVARVVADTGLNDVALNVVNYRPMVYASAAGWGKLFPVKDLFLNSFLAAGHFDTRESLAVSATHVSRMGDETLYGGKPSYSDKPHERRVGAALFGLLFLAVAASYVTGFWAYLYMQYNHAVTLREPSGNIDPWGAFDNSRWFIVQPVVDYARGAPPSPYSRAGNWTFGFVLTGLLAFLRLRFSWWPLHPVGYLLVNTSPIRWGWFSFFVGWCVKSLVVRFGGAKLYTSLKPFVIGIVVGEALASVFWLLAAYVLVWLDIPFRTITT